MAHLHGRLAHDHALRQGIAQRTCAVGGPHRSRHAHTLYQQSLKHEASFFIEYFALDLIMENGECRGVIALDMAEARCIGSAAHKVILGPAAMAAPGFRALGAYLHRRWRGWRCAPDCRCRTWSSCNSIRRHLWAGCLITEARAGEGGYSPMPPATIHGTYAPNAKDWRRACGQPIQTIRDPRGPRRGKLKVSHSSASGTLGAAVIHERLPGIAADARIFARVDVNKEPIPVLPTVHYKWAASRAMCTARRSPAPTHTKRWCGIDGGGEAACVSVHGANRLGSNSLSIGGVRARGSEHCARVLKPGAAHRSLKADSCTAALDRLDRLRNAKGSLRTRRYPPEHAACDAKVTQPCSAPETP